MQPPATGQLRGMQCMSPYITTINRRCFLRVTLRYRESLLRKATRVLLQVNSWQHDDAAAAAAHGGDDDDLVNTASCSSLQHLPPCAHSLTTAKDCHAPSALRVGRGNAG